MPTAKAKCHPEKINFGGGLCANCYYRKRYKEDRAFRKKKNAAGKRWREANRGSSVWRKYKLKYRFGMSLESYDSLLKRQHGRCAACGRRPLKGLFLVVDHDHRCCPGERSCGRCVRALIHSKCNVALGAADDDPKVLAALLRYAKRHR